MSDSRAIDQESRRIIREDLLTNILVEAGAGSGKTQMLAERMAAGVASGVYQVEHMAAVTFTRKAASELRGRFIAWGAAPPNSRLPPSAEERPVCGPSATLNAFRRDDSFLLRVFP